MTLENLVFATDYDVYLYSMWTEQEPKPETFAFVSDLLRGCSGIMDLNVHHFTISPEDLAVYAFVDLPEPVVKAIYKYNKMEVIA